MSSASSDSSGSNSLIPREKDCALAFGLQAAPGVAGTPTLLFPLDNGSDAMGGVYNRVVFQYADGAEGLRHYRSDGEWSEGSLDVPLLPTWIDGDFGDWLWGRDSANYNDGWYATIYRRIGNLYEQFKDVRVTKGTIERRAEGAIRAKLDLVGCSGPTAGSAADFAGLSAGSEPYTFDQASLELAAGSGTYGTPGASMAADVSTLDHTLEWDNMAADPKDMLTVGSGLNPSALPFADAAHWRVTFSRYLSDLQLYNDFKAGNECAYEFTLTHTLATCVFLMPRIIYMEHPLAIPDGGFIKSDGIVAQALASTDGATPACTVTETVA